MMTRIVMKSAAFALFFTFLPSMALAEPINPKPALFTSDPPASCVDAVKPFVDTDSEWAADRYAEAVAGYSAETLKRWQADPRRTIVLPPPSELEHGGDRLPIPGCNELKAGPGQSETAAGSRE
jgi:hypothetical protein